MKTKDKKDKEFDTVKAFREIKEKISRDTFGMTFEQFKSYLANPATKPKSWKPAQLALNHLLQD